MRDPITVMRALIEAAGARPSRRGPRAQGFGPSGPRFWPTAQGLGPRDPRFAAQGSKVWTPSAQTNESLGSHCVMSIFIKNCDWASKFNDLVLDFWRFNTELLDLPTNINLSCLQMYMLWYGFAADSFVQFRGSAHFLRMLYYSRILENSWIFSHSRELLNISAFSRACEYSHILETSWIFEHSWEFASMLAFSRILEHCRILGNSQVFLQFP